MSQDNLAFYDFGVNRRICMVVPKSGDAELASISMLESLGCTVVPLFYRENRDQLGQRISNVNADLLVVFRGEGIPPETIRNAPCPTVLWYGEYFHGADGVSRARFNELSCNAAAFDYVIFCGENEPESLQLLRNLASNRVGYAYPGRFDPAVYRKLDIPKAFDVSFLGSITPRRKTILETLNRRFKVFVKNIWDIEEQVRFFNQSKISLHINFAPFIHSATLNLRTQDILGCGSFLLHEDVVFRSKYEDAKHLVYWRNGDADDLSRKVEYYLTHEQEREEIAAGGHEHLRKTSSAGKTYQRLLSQIDFQLKARTMPVECFGHARDKWGRPTQSFAEFKGALEPVSSAAYPHSFLQRGLLHLQLHRWKQAADLFEQALMLDSECEHAMYLLAVCYERTRHPNRAIKELTRLLRIAPLNPRANRLLGELHRANGRTDLSEYFLQKAGRLDQPQQEQRYGEP